MSDPEQKRIGAEPLRVPIVHAEGPMPYRGLPRGRCAAVHDRRRLVLRRHRTAGPSLRRHRQRRQRRTDPLRREGPLGRAQSLQGQGGGHSGRCDRLRPDEGRVRRRRGRPRSRAHADGHHPRRRTPARPGRSAPALGGLRRAVGSRRRHDSAGGPGTRRARSQAPQGASARWGSRAASSRAS